MCSAGGLTEVAFTPVRATAERGFADAATTQPVPADCPAFGYVARGRPEPA